MEWGINDSLKSRAYGQKKDTTLKEQHSSAERTYYPTDREGKIDEWGAMVKHQTALHQAKEKERYEKIR